MQLTRFSDLGLRVLMYLTAPVQGRVVTIGEIAEQFQVSQHHLSKVMHRMAQLGWIHTSRGKGGGLTLAKPVSAYRLGEVVRALEDTVELIDCEAPPCALRGQCVLKGLLDEAMRAFFLALDHYTLADAVASPTHDVIVTLHRLGVTSRASDSAKRRAP